jgi:hypothetical protein
VRSSGSEASLTIIKGDPVIEATQRLLHAAQFFYRHLVEERSRPSTNEPEAFRYYFYAFINAAARSITWTMQSEEKEKYDAWKPKWHEQLTPAQRKLEKLTNDLRIAEAKRGGADFIVEFEEVALSKLFRNFEIQMGRPAYLMVEEAGPPGMRPGKTFRPSYYLESDDGKAEVTVVCKQYLDHVEKLVQDFLTAQQ